MKNMQLFLDAFVLALLVLIHLYRPGENLRCHNVTQYKSYFFNFFIYFCSFRPFRWFRFGRFARFACSGRFGGFVSLVSLVSVVSFRPFRFVVRVLVHAREQANLHARKQIILQVFSWGYGLNIYLNL